MSAQWSGGRRRSADCGGNGRAGPAPGRGRATVAVALGLLVALRWAVAGPTAAQATERAELRAEREAVETRYRAAERDCRDRLLVSACLRDAQQLRREALDAVRERELALEEAIRRAEVQQNAQRRAAKAGAALPTAGAEAARSAASAASVPAGAGAPAPRPSAPDTGGWRRAEPGSGKPQPPPAQREAQRAAAAAERAAAQQRRASEAQAHREAVERRNAERAAKGRAPAAPLPIPASAPAG